jgi:hypothetical protein
MAQTYRRKYGLDWPKETPDHVIELHMWKKWREPGIRDGSLLNPVHEHVLKAIRLLFTEDQVKIHPWMEVQARSWTEDTFAGWWGCAGSGKSQSLGLFSLLDYMADPNETFTLLASTSKDMLLLRSYASVTQHLGYLKTNPQLYVPLKYVAQSVSVVMDGMSEEETLNLKTRLKGVAVQQGTEQEARANLQGVHVKYVRLILDELEGMRPAAMDARNNLSQCEDFRLFYSCNPESWNGPAAKFGTPVDGITSINLDSTEWASPYGKVYRFDAYKSPGIEAPEKYPFLPNKKTIDRIVAANAGNEDAPAVWTFLRAFPPPQGAERTVITPQMVESYAMKDGVTWMQATTRIAACDPAFTAEGDNAVLVTGQLGLDNRGLMTLCYDNLHYLSIEASSKTPVVQQLVEQIRDIVEQEGIDPLLVAFDDSGSQSVADAYEMLIERTGVYRVNFAARAPDIAVSMTNPQLASERYKNRVTWLYYLIQELAQRGQIRGLPENAVEQFCLRRLGAKQKPLTLESKREYKKRTSSTSPDEADACALMAGLARERLGLMPGSSELFPGGMVFPSHSEQVDLSFVRKINNLSSRYNYSR